MLILFLLHSIEIMKTVQYERLLKCLDTYLTMCLLLLQGFKVFFFLVGGLYLLYLLYLLVRAYAELRSMPYFGMLYIYCI